MKLGLVTLFLALTGCADRSPVHGGPAADSAAEGQVGVAAASGDDRGWSSSGPVDYRRIRPFDFTRDGSAEHVIVTAAGPAYDSLDVTLTIRSPAGDTLWREQWPSLMYFNYDPLEGKADSTVVRIVRGHIEELLAVSRFHAEGGLPPALSHGDPTETMREAVRYHLAELDWRRDAGLGASAGTPPHAYSAIDASAVSQRRVESVVAELRTAPSFMYYAGGEVTYALAWSGLENAFVRIYSCC